MNAAVLWAIASTFGLLSLVAIGGANALVPEIHASVVTRWAWMDDATFTQLFAIAQAAPGPNVLLVSLIGWHVAGLAGMLVATVAIVAPSSIVAFAVGRVIDRNAETRWIRAFQAGLTPIAVGLILSSGMVASRASITNGFYFLVTAATVLFVVYSRQNPLWTLGIAAVVCGAGRALGFL